jgi:hypothetical protein
MDPNAALAIIRDRAESLQEYVDAGSAIFPELTELLEAFQAIEEAGGVLRSEWETDENLSIIRDRCNALEEVVDADTDDEIPPELQELIEAFQGLDGWVERGGFMPRDWNKPEP